MIDLKTQKPKMPIVPILDEAKVEETFNQLTQNVKHVVSAIYGTNHVEFERRFDKTILECIKTQSEVKFPVFLNNDLNQERKVLLTVENGVYIIMVEPQTGDIQQ